MAQTQRKTPADLSTEMTSVEISDVPFDRERQIRYTVKENIVMTTFNATQTFDAKGTPKDRDNDK